MLNPTPYFDADYFDTQDVTLPRLQKFSVDVIQRLTLDNPGSPVGVFTPLIQDLTTYHTALFGAVVAADAGTSQRRGAAQAMWGAIADLQHQLEADEALIEYKAKKNPGLYTAFFPDGRREYTRATLLTAELLLSRAATAAATHAATLGPDFDAAPYAAFRDAFVAARTSTGAGDEQNAKARAEAAGHRQDLTQRLTDAVKLVAAQHLRDAPRAAAYFRVELLQASGGASPAAA